MGQPVLKDWLRTVGSTGIQLSPIGLGTVKLGRDQGVKYPQHFVIPDDRAATQLLGVAQDLGINLIDTAPAYGNSEQRLGELLKGQRQRWVICSKVGEEFEQGQSRFDFSPEHTRYSVERSLGRLNCDVIDLVLVHSNGEDEKIINSLGTLEALADLRRAGKIRAFGISTKSVAGGLAAAELCDVLMVTYNLGQQEEVAVLDKCLRLGTAVMIKKALASGHLAEDYPDPVQASMNLIFQHAATTSAIIGTINPQHLTANVAAARLAIALNSV
jgi:aryl-alcohol dehydrogenase-like predicted oxidoreductase